MMLHGAETEGDHDDETDELAGILQCSLDQEMLTSIGERLEPHDVTQRKEEELRRFEVIGVYSPVPRSHTSNDFDGIKVIATWEVTQNGTQEETAIKARQRRRALCTEMCGFFGSLWT